MPNRLRPLPGARESNAGDDFHVLWAARRALWLLNPRSDLQRVVMEGVTPLEEVDSEDEGLLGVDLTEYFEGSNFPEAERVVTTQLKYSTRHPEQEWTDARLRERGSSSVLRRLANIYKTFADKHDRTEAIRKLDVRLVSNQPVEGGLRAASAAARQELASLGTIEVKTADLLKRLPSQQMEVLQRLYKASRLRSVEFTDFLRVFDLSGCGEEGRMIQRLRLIQELAPLVTNDPVEGLRNLKEVIEHEAQPERAGSTGLTKPDVLAALGVGSEEDIFPAPSDLKSVPRKIRTSEARSLGSVVAGESEHCQILVHGDAGVGKTTTLQAMQSHLPEGSVVVIYDCYGGGQYLVAGEQRHTNGRVFQQLINEFAVSCGTPFLVHVDGEVSDIQRRFSRTLDAAAQIVDAEGGLLVVAIDAADNAVFAARKEGDRCFVPPLWTIPLPENARLLMTARSHRRGELDAPEHVTEYELHGFDAEASASHLRMVFPEAEDAQCRVFHERTGGNPRYQSYSLEPAERDGGGVNALDQVLTAAVRTPKDVFEGLNGIFEGLFDAAIMHASNPDQAQQLAATLVCLSPPTPVNVLADVCDVPSEQAHNFCRALVPGVVFENDAARFRDEDFENYLRKKVGDVALEIAEARLGEHFLSRAGSDLYAARSVAGHLFAAERHGDVIALTLEGPEPSVIRDDIERLRVHRRRVTLAMRSASAINREDEAFRLILLAAELACSNEAANSVIMEQPGLAAIYGNPDDVARLYLRDPDKPWLGPAHFKIAAMHSRETSFQEQASEHLRMADAWIRRWQALPDTETFDWHLTTGDVAAGAEAIYRLRGAEAARDWLMRWRPRIVRLHAAYDLVKELSRRGDVSTLEKELTALELPALVEAALLAAIFAGGGLPSRELVEDVAQRLDQAGHRGRTHAKLGSGWAATFCELHAVHGLDPERTLRFLRVFELSFPDFVPSEYDDLSDYDVPLRMLCLRAILEKRALTTDELIPERYREQKGADPHRYDSNENELRRFRETVGKILGAYQLRAKTVAQRLTVAEVSETLEPELSGRRSESEHRWFKFDRRYKVWARKASEALINAEGDAEPKLMEIADLAKRAVKAGAPALWIDLAERMLKNDAYHHLGYRLIERAAHAIDNQPRPGRDRWETLLRCATVVNPYEASLGRDLYLRAVAAAESLDDESALLLKLHTRCAHTAASGFSEEQRRNLAARTSRLVELHESHVSASSVLPWEEALGAIAALDPAGGLALCSRWDDEDRLLIRDGIAEVVRVATDSNYLSPEEGLHLLRLAAERFDVSADAVRLMEHVRSIGPSARPRLVAMMREVSFWVRRDVLPGKRSQAASRIVEWADVNSIDTLPGIVELREVLRFLEPLSGREGEDTMPSPSAFGSDPEHEARLREEREAEDKASAAALRDAIADARGGKFDDLLERHEVYRQGSYRSDRRDEADFFEEIQNVVPPAAREQYLDALTEMGDDALTARIRMHAGVAEALQQALIAWKGSSAVQSWKTQGISNLLQLHLPNVVAYDYNARDTLRIVLSQPAPGDTPTSLLLPAVAEHAETLDTRSLYDIADVLVTDLTPDKQGETLTWSIDRVEEKVARDRGSLPELPSEPDFSEASEALANFLWTAFGHPWKPVRWRAAHAARALLLLPDLELLQALVARLNSETAGVFRSEHLEFFWMSARAWLLVVLERLADERPELLCPHVEAIAEHALNPDFPHAQIRELAKRTVLRVVEHDPDLLPADKIERLRRSNAPGSCLYPRQSPYSLRLGDRLKQSSGEGFGFDEIDTVPYWFSPLGRVFAKGPDDVADKVENWIRNRWGRTRADWRNDPRELRSERLAAYFYNRHGSIPRAENLRLHLFYQGMQCAAGELIDELPVLVDEYDGECAWAAWLEYHFPANSKFWLADLRAPTPFRQASWGYFPPMEEWLERPDPTEYDAALGIGEQGHEDEIVVDGDIEEYDRERRGTVRVASALVSPDTASALLHALQTTDPGNFRLPYEGEESECDDFEISELDFVLQGWISGWRREREYLDKHDPLTREIEGPFSLLGQNFTETLSLSASDDFLTYSTPTGEIVGRLEIWSDNPQEKDYITEAFSTGQRLWVNTEVLLDYLRRREMDLIVEVQISRNVERRYSTGNSTEEREYDLGRSTIYILRRDGSLETLAGRRSPGTAHSS